MSGEAPAAPEKWHQLPSLAVVALVPILYLLGFLAWSMHAVFSGLGFLPLSTAQYLAPGVVMFLVMAVSIAAYMLMLAASKRAVDRFDLTGSRWNAVPIRALLAGIATVLVIGGTLYAGAAIGLFHLTTFSVLVTLVGSFVLVLAFSWMAGGFAEDGLKVGRFLGRKSVKTQPGRGKLDRRLPDVPTVAIIFVVILAFAGLLPQMSSEFGGARDRLASFDLDPSKLSSNTLSRLWPDWNGTAYSGLIVRTPEVRVLFANQDVVLARPLDENRWNGALFEVPRSIINAIVWS